MATRGWTASPPRRGATKGLRKEARLGTLGDRKKAQQNLGLGKLFLPHHLGETQDCMPSPSLPARSDMGRVCVWQAPGQRPGTAPGL